MKKFITEFKEFISRGNVIDMAVGVVMGTAFSAIVTSLVNDIIMPIVGVILNGVDFSGLVVKIGESKIAYGSFIQAIVNFLIIALCIFCFVKAINKFRKQEEPKEEPAPEPTAEEKLLTEILDVLKSKEAK